MCTAGWHLCKFVRMLRFVLDSDWSEAVQLANEITCPGSATVSVELKPLLGYTWPLLFVFVALAFVEAFVLILRESYYLGGYILGPFFS